MTENEIEKQIIDYVTAKGVRYLKLTFRGSHKRGNNKNNTGFPDLLIFAKTGLIAIEIKQTGKESTLTKPQEEWRDYFINSGYEWYMITSFEQFIEIYEG